MATPTRFALTIMCEDQVGLVARITSALCEKGGNIEQLFQGVLQGYFVITMLVTFENGCTEDDVRNTVQPLSEGGLVISILPRKETVPPAAQGQPFVLTLAGQDSPGILKRTTGFLADRKINIERLSSKVMGDDFVIIAYVTIPDELPIPSLRLDLSEIHRENNITVNLMHEDIFAATSRIDMQRVRKETAL